MYKHFLFLHNRLKLCRTTILVHLYTVPCKCSTINISSVESCSNRNHLSWSQQHQSIPTTIITVQQLLSRINIKGYAFNSVKLLITVYGRKLIHSSSFWVWKYPKIKSAFHFLQYFFRHLSVQGILRKPHMQYSILHMQYSMLHMQ